MKKYYSALLFIPLLISPEKSAFAQEISAYDSCMKEMLQSATDDQTVGELKAVCLEKSEINLSSTTETDTPQSDGANPITERIQTEEENILKPFTLMAHNQNYVLLAAYNFKGWDSAVYDDTDGERQLDLDKTEVQFQLSIKMPLLVDTFGSGIDTYAAYTGHSFWQAYNSSNSSPFRETNHEPEIWIERKSNLSVGPVKNVLNRLGVVHQSNGQGGTLSRSWNRIFANFGFEAGNLAFVVKPWYRIKEDLADDDNPDITDYLGHGEIFVAYKWHENVFSLMSRNNIESGFSKGALELSWSFPIFDYEYIKGYVQYFTGYGESLIDYDNYVNKIGFGFLLTDYL